MISADRGVILKRYFSDVNTLSAFRRKFYRKKNPVTNFFRYGIYGSIGKFVFAQ